MTTTDNISTINFMYFTQNYPHGFIQKVWADDTRLADHFQEKFASMYDRYGASASVVRFFFELSTSHQYKLLDWVNNNYKAF